MGVRSASLKEEANVTGITFVPYLKRIFGSILYAKISKNSYCLNMSYGLNECLRLMINIH